MARFAYEAVTGSGRTVRGVEEASTGSEAERALRDRGVRPLSLTRADATPEHERPGRRRLRADVTAAVRYLSTLLEAGFPLDRALEVTAGLVARSEVAEAVGEVRSRVRGGASLSEALGEEELFPPLATGMARAGERGGDLARALGRLAEHLEREEELKSRVASALLYPALMTGVGGAALAVLVFYVLPRFVGILEEAGAALPRSTALLLATGDFLGRWWGALLVAALAATAAIVAWGRSESGRRAVARLLLRLPVVGPLRRRAVAVRFGRSLGELLRSGLAIVPALEVASASLADPATADELAAATERVRAGEKLADAVGQGRAFPPLFLRMTAVGEEGGRLPDMLDRAAGVAEDELERGLERLVRLVEPTMVVVFGVLVGLVALSLLQAIYGVRLQPF